MRNSTEKINMKTMLLFEGGSVFEYGCHLLREIVAFAQKIGS